MSSSPLIGSVGGAANPYLKLLLAIVAIVAIAGLASPSAILAGAEGEIRLDVTKKPPKLLGAGELPGYFAGALRATHSNEGGISVVWKAVLVREVSDVVAECESSDFKIAAGKPVQAEALARGFTKCFVPPGNDGQARFELADLGSAAVPVNLGLWNPNLGLWAQRRARDAAYVIVIALVPTSGEVDVASMPRVFILKYPIEHG